MFDSIFFLAASAWNTAIPPDAFTHFIPPATGWLDTYNGNYKWTIPVYFAGETDPLRPVLYNEDAWSKVATGAWKRWGNSPDVEAEILASSSKQFPHPGNVFSSISSTRWVLPSDYNKLVNPPNGTPARYHYNISMHPASQTDGHMVVIQPDERHAVESYSTIVLSGGQIIALSYSVSNIKQSLGDGWQNGQTASMLPALAGIIDDSELAKNIGHVMAVTARPSCLSPAIVYPAYAFDRDATTSTSPPSYSGTLPMGARVALPRELDLNALGLRTPQGQAIAAAAQKYGFIINDRNGGSGPCGFTVRVRPNPAVPEPALHRYDHGLSADINQIFAHIVEVHMPSGEPLEGRRGLQPTQRE